MFNSGLMIRIGRTEEIEKQYRECYIRFSCPANWINYASNHAPGIANKYEAIFAHVDKFDPRLWMTCSDGVPLYGTLWRSENSDGTIYARYLYSCLVPTVCFYSLGISKLAKQMGIKDNQPGRITIDLRSYYKAMNVSPEESSVLVIRFPGLFIPGLQSYSFIYPASRCKTMAFENFTQNLKRYDILCGDKE